MNTQGPSQPEKPRELRQTAPVYRTHAAAEERRRGRRMLPLSTVLLVAVVGGALLLSNRFQKSTEGDTSADSVASSTSSGGTAAASASTASSGYGGWSGSTDTSSSDSAGGSSSPAAGGSGSTTQVTAGTSGTGNSPPPAVTEGVTELSTRVAAILKKHCFDCHGLEQKVENFIVTDHSLLLDTAGTRPADERYVVAGDLEASVLWQRSGGEFRDMPPEEREQLTAAELADIRTWIETGAAPFPTEGIREQMPRMELWRLVRDDLNQADEADRSHYRYFSFLNLHNDSFATQIGRNRGNYSDRDIRLARAALSKLVNSLSYMPAAVAPVPLGDRQLVMRIDLRDYGWVDLKVWAKLQEAYPYGIRLTVNPDEQLRTLVKEVNTLSGTELPVLRADWFIDTAPRAELYYTIMALPGTVGELETLLGVDPVEDFKNNKLKRAGFSSSGVSKSNRLVDRHEFLSTRFGRGVYWKSYDFAKSEDRGNLFKFPLGPKFDGNEFADHAFVHDGGEMIFSLPNGLQGYYLGDGAEKRISEGPVNVVEDSKSTSGTPAVVNAISCMACHHSGIVPFTDDVRIGRSVPLGEARFKVDELYPKQSEMDELIAKDQQRFLKALRPLLAPFLDEEASGTSADSSDRSGTSASEPIQVTAKRYQAPLEIEQAAAELGFSNPEELQYRIRTSSQLRELGLAPLAEGGTIKRTTWASTAESLFHTLARELEIGTPLEIRPADLPED